VASQRTKTDVEGLVVDQQPDDLAVGDVDEHLARFRVAIARLRIGQRARFVEAVEVGAGEAIGLALVQVRAQPNVAVAQGKH
jgi:hypothetical protein